MSRLAHRLLNSTSTCTGRAWEKPQVQRFLTVASCQCDPKSPPCFPLHLTEHQDRGESMFFSATENVVVPEPLGDAISTEAISNLGNYPSHYVMQSLEVMHVVTGLPYWATIVVATLGLRTAMLPLAIRTMRNSTRMALLRPELQLIMDRMKNDTSADADPKRQKMYKKQMDALFKKYDAYPMRSLQFPIVQLPIFMSFFFALKSMGDFFPSINEGGILWFSDLSAPDSYAIFPVITAGSFVSCSPFIYHHPPSNRILILRQLDSRTRTASHD